MANNQIQFQFSRCMLFNRQIVLLSMFCMLWNNAMRSDKYSVNNEAPCTQIHWLRNFRITRRNMHWITTNVPKFEFQGADFRQFHHHKNVSYILCCWITFLSRIWGEILITLQHANSNENSLHLQRWFNVFHQFVDISCCVLHLILFFVNDFECKTNVFFKCIIFVVGK